MRVLRQIRQRSALPVLITISARDQLKTVSMIRIARMITHWRVRWIARINALLRRGHAETAQLKNQSQLLKNGYLVLMLSSIGDQRTTD